MEPLLELDRFPAPCFLLAQELVWIVICREVVTNRFDSYTKRKSIPVSKCVAPISTQTGNVSTFQHVVVRIPVGHMLMSDLKLGL